MGPVWDFNWLVLWIWLVMGVIPILFPLIHPPEVGSSDLPASDKTPVNLPRVMMMMMMWCAAQRHKV